MHEIHLMRFADYFKNAFAKADAVALNKLVQSSPIATAAETPLCHLAAPVRPGIV